MVLPGPNKWMYTTVSSSKHKSSRKRLLLFYQSWTHQSLHNSGNVFPSSCLTFRKEKRNPLFLGDACILYFIHRFRIQLLYDDMCVFHVIVISNLSFMTSTLIKDHDVVFLHWRYNVEERDQKSYTWACGLLQRCSSTQDCKRNIQSELHVSKEKFPTKPRSVILKATHPQWSCTSKFN